MSVDSLPASRENALIVVSASPAFAPAVEAPIAPVRIDLGDVDSMTATLVDQDPLFVGLKELLDAKDDLARAISARFTQTIAHSVRAASRSLDLSANNNPKRNAESLTEGLTFVALKLAIQKEMEELLEHMMPGSIDEAVDEWAKRVKIAYSTRDRIALDNFVTTDFQGLKIAGDVMKAQINVGFHEMVDAIANSLTAVIPADQEDLCSELRSILDAQRNAMLPPRAEGSTDFVGTASGAVTAGHTALQHRLDTRYNGLLAEFQDQTSLQAKEAKIKEHADRLDRNAGSFMGQLVRLLKAEASSSKVEVSSGNGPKVEENSLLTMASLEHQATLLRNGFCQLAQAMFEANVTIVEPSALALPSEKMKACVLAFQQYLNLQNLVVTDRSVAGLNVVSAFDILAEEMVGVVAEYVKGGVTVTGARESAVDVKIERLKYLMSKWAFEASQKLVAEFGLNADPIAQLTAGNADLVKAQGVVANALDAHSKQLAEERKLIAGGLTGLHTAAGHTSDALHQFSTAINESLEEVCTSYAVLQGALTRIEGNIGTTLQEQVGAMAGIEERIATTVRDQLGALSKAAQAGYAEGVRAGHQEGSTRGRFVGAFLGSALTVVVLGFAGSAYMLFKDKPERTTVSASTVDDRRGEGVEGKPELVTVQCEGGKVKKVWATADANQTALWESDSSDLAVFEDTTRFVRQGNVFELPYNVATVCADGEAQKLILEKR